MDIASLLQSPDPSPDPPPDPSPDPPPDPTGPSRLQPSPKDPQFRARRAKATPSISVAQYETRDKTDTGPGSPGDDEASSVLADMHRHYAQELHVVAGHMRDVTRELQRIRGDNERICRRLDKQLQMLWDVVGLITNPKQGIPSVGAASDPQKKPTSRRALQPTGPEPAAQPLLPVKAEYKPTSTALNGTAVRGTKRGRSAEVSGQTTLAATAMYSDEKPDAVSDDSLARHGTKKARYADWDCGKSDGHTMETAPWKAVNKASGTEEDNSWYDTESEADYGALGCSPRPRPGHGLSLVDANSASDQPAAAGTTKPRYSRPRRTVTRYASGPPGRPFQFTRMGRTVASVWHEWMHGDHGNPAIEELEERYGTGWRAGSLHERKYASNWVANRKLIVKYVMSMCSKTQLTPDDMCRRLDRRVSGRLQELLVALRARKDPMQEIEPRA